MITDFNMLSKTYLFVVLLFVCSIQRSDAVLVKNCGSYFQIDDVKLDDCEEEAAYCTFFIGGKHNLSFSIDVGEFGLTANLLNKVNLIIGWTHFALAVSPNDPCDVLQCPLNDNYKARYSTEIYVNETLMPTRAELEWIMMTEDNEQVVCFSFPVVLSFGT